MNEQLMRQAGFNEEMDRVAKKCCPICGNPVNVVDFKDSLSWREFEISGMCQKCQDEVFGE